MDLLKEILDNRRFMEALYKTMEDPLVLPFVNREQEIKTLSVSLIKDSLKAALGTTDNQAYLMPFLPQLFGAGKTTIGKCLLEQANAHRDDILQELSKVDLPLLPNNLEQHIATLPPDQQQQARAQQRAHIITGQLDKFLGATYVHISLDKLPSPTSNFPAFVDGLYALIQRALVVCGINPTRELTNLDRSDIQAFVTAITGGRAVMLHFDDVGSLLDYSKYHGYFAGMIDQNGVSIDTHPKWEMKRIYKLWNEIHLLNKMDGVYCFMSGKRSALIFLGQKLLDRDNERPESPTGSIALILRMFTSHYIRMIADQLNLWGTLGITDEDLKARLVDAIQQLTGGVPRLVSWTMKVLLHGMDYLGRLFTRVGPDDLKLILRELLYNIFTHDERSNVLALPEILASPTTMALYLRLLVLSQNGKAIDKNMKLEFMQEATSIPLSVVVSALDCYVDKEDGDEWKLVFPELVLLWVANNSTDQRLSFFARSILVDPDVAKPGPVNEKVFRLTLETLLTADPFERVQQPKPLCEVFPFTANTQLAGWRLRMQPNGFVPVPKISGRANKVDDNLRTLLCNIVSRPREEWVNQVWELYLSKHKLSTIAPSYSRKRGHGGGISADDRDKLVSFLTSTVHFDDSNFILDNLIPDGCLGCPTSDMSGWPDFVIAEHAQQAGERVLKYALWWQIKLLGEETSFTWAAVQKEINKVPLVAEHGCLVIASTHINPDIAAQIGNGTHLLVPPGGFNDKGKAVLTVPAHLEVVILGEKGLAQLYSEYDLEGLKHLAAANTFEAISKRIQQPTGTLVGIALAHTPIPGRAVKITFTDSHSNSPICSDILDLPFGTTLVGATAAIQECLGDQEDTVLQTRKVMSILWNNVLIVRDNQLERVKDGHELIVNLQ
jgi:hypothetical protein